jgi:hypothetical protein
VPGIKIDTAEVLPRGQVLEHTARLNRRIHVELPAFTIIEMKQQGIIRLRLHRANDAATMGEVFCSNCRNNMSIF